jgi:chemotaxis methyl-accepting protein methylase
MTQSLLLRMSKLKVLGKSPMNAYLRLNRWLWSRMPCSLTNLRLMRSYGTLLNTLARLGDRRQFFGTYFLRNRPELELISRLSDLKGKGSVLKISVLGCSNGAEVYSILWTIRLARPDLKVIVHAVDISREVLELAREGVYSLQAPELVDEPIFIRMTEKEMQEMFDKEGDQVGIKAWIKEGIIWHVGDAGDPEILNVLGPQDIVVANNFLCHMDPPHAERCLRNITRLVNSGGYLFVSGVDLDVRTKVARDLRWIPIKDLMEDIHEGDPGLRNAWPFAWWGLEPFNKRRKDWQLRYASVFQLN